LGKQLLVTPPTYRQDLALPEDLIEEVIRTYGYDKIPYQDMPSLQVVPDITPKNIILAEIIRDILIARGFDEVLSWPLTMAGDNSLVNYLSWRSIATQNSINELFPDLRQSIATGLIIQLKEYLKKNVEFINIFEIGKIFGEKNEKYLEQESLGVLSASSDKSLSKLKNNLEILLRSIGLSDLKYFNAKNKPMAANPDACWEIQANEKSIGIIYKLKPLDNKLNIYFAEINLTLITEMLQRITNNPVVEITQKLISLDANVELNKNQSIYQYLGDLEKKIDKNNLWSLSIADAYPLPARLNDVSRSGGTDKIRYTIRAVYKELSDQEAKKIHLSVFNL
jgi:phenylalanyl-tRNA synthetase beta chain